MVCMIKRIVKLTIKKEHINSFKTIFEQSKDHIAAQPGCYHVEMLQDTADPRHCFTYSIWKDQESLDLYRKSDLFGEVWPKTKLLFDEKPEAWSLELQGIGISPADLHLHQY